MPDVPLDPLVPDVPDVPDVPIDPLVPLSILIPSFDLRLTNIGMPNSLMNGSDLITRSQSLWCLIEHNNLGPNSYGKILGSRQFTMYNTIDISSSVNEFN